MGRKKKGDMADNTEIRRLNLLALGQEEIGRRLGCHPATISIRLKEMGESANDTRKNLMDKICKDLDREVLEWLADELLTSGISIETFFMRMIQQKHKEGNSGMQVVQGPLPVMDAVARDASQVGTGTYSVDNKGNFTHCPTETVFK